MRTELQYKNSQERISTSKSFRYFWQFWAIYSFVFFLVAFIYIFTKPNWQEVLVLSAVSFFLARIVIVTTINFFYKRPRPYQKFAFDLPTSKFFSFRTTRPNSFPSRHTLAYMAVAVVVLMYFPWIGIVLVIVSLLAGGGRVILGYHWPSDILAGAIIGALIGYFTVIYILPGLFT